MATLLSLNEAEVSANILLNAGKTPVFVGTSGVGKTEKVRDIARKRNAFFVSITCSLMQEGDLMLPVPQQQEADLKMSRFLELLLLQNSGVDISEEIKSFMEIKSETNSENAVIRAIDEDILKIIRYLRENPEGEAILFLDELNRASVAVQAELMNVILAKELKGTKIPDNCKIMVAMNPSNDMGVFQGTRYAVNSGDVAIKDRLAYLFIKPSVFEWAEWGLQPISETNLNSILDERVISFLLEQPNPNELFIMDDNSEYITGTPRSWKDVSDILREYEKLGIDSTLSLQAMIEGKVGVKAGTLFMGFLGDQRNYFSSNLIFEERDEFTEEELNRFKNSTEFRKVSILQSIMQKIHFEMDLSPTQLESPKYNYLRHPMLISKFNTLVRIMGERASDNSLTILRQARNKYLNFWKIASENEEFIDIALENKMSLD